MLSATLREFNRSAEVFHHCNNEQVIGVHLFLHCWALFCSSPWRIIVAYRQNLGEPVVTIYSQWLLLVMKVADEAYRYLCKAWNRLAEAQNLILFSCTCNYSWSADNRNFVSVFNKRRSTCSQSLIVVLFPLQPKVRSIRPIVFAVSSTDSVASRVHHMLSSHICPLQKVSFFVTSVYFNRCAQIRFTSHSKFSVSFFAKRTSLANKYCCFNLPSCWY